MIASTRLLPVILIFMLTSCSFGSAIQRNALDFNSRVAATSNQQIVLNILRASRNESLHFTAVNQVRGSYAGAMALGADADFIGGGAGNTLVLKPSVTIGSNPSFDLAVLNNQEFYQGILKPVSAELFDYFASTGIRDEIILYLLVEEVRYRDRTFRNRAGTDDFCTFQKFVDDNIKEEGMLRQLLKKLPTTVEIPFDATAEGALKGLAAMVQSGFQIEQDDDEDKIVITKSTPKIVLEIPNREAAEFYDQASGVEGNITLRSPIGIFEYLGEVLNRIQQVEVEIAYDAERMCRSTVDEESFRRRISKRADMN